MTAFVSDIVLVKKRQFYSKYRWYKSIQYIIAVTASKSVQYSINQL